MKLTEINQLDCGTHLVLDDGTRCRYEAISFEEGGPKVIVTFASDGGGLLEAGQVARIDDDPPVWETSAVIDGLTRTVHIHHGYTLAGPHGSVTFSPRYRWGHTHQPATQDDLHPAPSCRTTDGPCVHYRMTDKTVRNIIWAWESAGNTDEAMFAVLEREWASALYGPQTQVDAGESHL